MDDLAIHLQTLGLKPGSSTEQIKQTYRDLIKVWHPDRFSHDERLRLIAQEKLKEINGAYEILIASAFDSGINPTTPVNAGTQTAPTSGEFASQEGAPTPASPKIGALWPLLGLLAVAAFVAAGFFLWEKGHSKDAVSLSESKPELPVAASNAASVSIRPVEKTTEHDNAASALLVDKTLVVWVTIDNLTQRAGSPMSIWQDSQFDAIHFAQTAPGKWEAGSEWWHRGDYAKDYPSETADSNTLVQVAIAYSGREISLYRNGKMLHQYTANSPPQLFESQSVVLFGTRGLDVNDHFAGTVQEARIYSQALTKEQIVGLKTGAASDPAPWAWWNFADGTGQERTGRFPAMRFIGGAKVDHGRLVLNGAKAIAVAGGSTELLEANVPTPLAGHCALSLNCTFPSFSGNTNYADLETTGALRGTFTVESWICARRTDGIQDLVGSRGPADCGFDLKLENAEVHADIGNGSNWITTDARAPFKFQANRWYHLACVVTPGQSALYIDGVLRAIKEYPANDPVLFDNEHQLRIGTADGHAEFLIGYVSELRIWQTARSPNEIRNNMSRKLTGAEPGLRGYWRLDEGAGALATDRTGHGLKGILVADADWTTNSPPLLKEQ